MYRESAYSGWICRKCELPIELCECDEIEKYGTKVEIKGEMKECLKKEKLYI